MSVTGAFPLPGSAQDAGLSTSRRSHRNCPLLRHDGPVTDEAVGQFLHNILNPDLPPGPPWTHTLAPSPLPEYTCGASGETFGTNCGPDDIACPECESRLCEHCGRWSGT